MVLTPRYYIADIQTGTLHGRALPLEDVTLTSSLQPGSFSASLDLRRLGGVGDGWDVMDLLADGKCTLVPVLEGTSTGIGNPPTSRALGEWWISTMTEDPPSPVIQIGGPELAGYLSEVLVTTTRVGTALDPVVTARGILGDAFTTGQTIVVDLQSWVSHTDAKIDVDIRAFTTDAWSAITRLQDDPAGPFEWMIRPGLVLDGWSPIRVTRTLEVGQPVLATVRDDITLQLAGPGLHPASVTAATRTRSEHRSASSITGWGAGAGEDQVGPVTVTRARATGEPVKSRMTTDRSALTVGQVSRRARTALARATPTQQVFRADMPTNRYTPLTGERYQWRSDATWSRRAESGTRRCVGWTWQSGQSRDVYTLQLVEE